MVFSSNRAKIDFLLQTDSRPTGSVFLKDVVPYVCIGLLCDRMPGKFVVLFITE